MEREEQGRGAKKRIMPRKRGTVEGRHRDTETASLTIDQAVTQLLELDSPGVYVCAGRQTVGNEAFNAA